ncbi:hypothetical protein ACOJBQ_002786 [Cronobacter muytjensii]|uniref:hypothetical protein n=1 Tax=Cronobacter muytjensii TaxID=413501 RepID=UPI0003A62046|nr:hypothetical protein [Cronobacter muytjensii]ALB70708.1 hypothetical protein AFK63_08835 [Cronobacter muytjensii ATCC 51329]
MNRFALAALVGATFILAACDDAAKEELNSHVKEAQTQAEALKAQASASAAGLRDSAQSQWDEAKEKASRAAQTTVSDLLPGDATAQLDAAKEKAASLSELKVSDFLPGNEEEEQTQDEQAQEEK